jgi:hypothetical protein
MKEMNDTESLTPVRDTSDYGTQSRGGNSTLDNIKNTVAEKLKTASEALKGRAGQNTPVSGYASQASGWLAGAADYVRDMEPSQVKTDIQRQVKTNPGRSLIIAGAAGLLLGALLRRR